MKNLEGHTDQVTSVSFSPDDKNLVSSSYDHKIKIWDRETGSVLYNLDGHTDYVTSACYSPNGKFIVSCSWD